jgi:hypothetical protein
VEKMKEAAKEMAMEMVMAMAMEKRAAIRSNHFRRCTQRAAGTQLPRQDPTAA